MNEALLRIEIERDLRKSGSETVIYLEGETDPAFLFSLLGVPAPTDNVYQRVLIRGLKTKRGSGSTAVMARVALTPVFPSSRIFGVTDGDGRKLGELKGSFDDPYSGPLFSWKAYCIENLMAKTGWPLAWGDPPDWASELSRYGPYVALNRVRMDVNAILDELRLARYFNPVQGSPTHSSTEIATALAAGKTRLLSFDVEHRFLEELDAYNTAVDRSIDEAHALMNGKWLLRHRCPTLTARDPDRCGAEWQAHAQASGGLPEVRDWWQRVTGNPP